MPCVYAMFNKWRKFITTQPAKMNFFWYHIYTCFRNLIQWHWSYVRNGEISWNLYEFVSQVTQHAIYICFSRLFGMHSHIRINMWYILYRPLVELLNIRFGYLMLFYVITEIDFLIYKQSDTHRLMLERILFSFRMTFF